MIAVTAVGCITAMVVGWTAGWWILNRLLPSQPNRSE